MTPTGGVAGMRPGDPATFVQRLLAYLLQSAVASLVLTPLVFLMVPVLVIARPAAPRESWSPGCS